MHACIVCYLNLVYQITVIDIGIVQWLSLFWSFQPHAYPFSPTIVHDKKRTHAILHPVWLINEVQDDASISWRKKKKHFFILSHSGKPIYSRYGDEHKLAGFSATLQAIISFVENGRDHIKLVRAGKHQVVFLVKGPIYLVCISCTEEPYESLMGQLELIYGQMILILTKSVNRCFEKNPKFDMTPLLGGTDVVFSSLINSLSWFVLCSFRMVLFADAGRKKIFAFAVSIL
ncbi:hypothetical protein OIU78_001495 [Salix suchowensis]|nr:hypothetical protein OIU78_001495 [Salix suchowensis]